jgi:class 3 adenylate cyclase/tetratricopeptide (TPR) repeat protein
MPTTSTGPRSLTPFVPRLLHEWLADDPDARYRVVDGTLAYIDISGFTELTERLAARGKVGAEELTDILDALFTDLLGVARQDGAYLVKWGGDAVLLLFEGNQHPSRAARAALRMRTRLQHFGRVRTPTGTVALQMSAGIHTGQLTFFLVGDPAIHRELMVCGPAASRTAQIEEAAQPGEIGLSTEAAALLAPACVDTTGPMPLVAAEPELADLDIRESMDSDDADLGVALAPSVRTYLQEDELTAEHRKVGVAFVRFSGTDDLLARGGPEQLASALDECVRVVQGAAARHGVTFVESDIDRDGGKIMIVAGAPRSAGHDEDRLLRVAWQIISTPTTLPLQIGVNRGAVFTGVIGPSFCRTFSVKGDAVNLAARVAAKARPGQALATLPTIAHAGARYEHEPLPPFRVKGKSAPIETASLGPAFETAVTPDTSAGELVAREVELSVLRSARDEAVAGTGALVEVVGEPGIGKSRLVQAMLAEIDTPSLLSSCDEYETATPYWPFRSLVKSIVGPGAPEVDAHMLRNAVQEHDATLLPWLPLLARIIDVEVPSTPAVDALADRFRQTRLQQVAAQFLIAALPSPIVLVFEDVHLMDGASVGLLEQLCDDVQSRSCLVVVTRRDVDEGFHPEGSAVVTVRPSALDDDAAARLAEAMGAAGTLTASVIATLAARAGGNPLFLRGLVRAAVDGANVDALPDTVEALITSQLDRLPAPERTVLRYASVLGMRFDKPALGALLGTRPMPSSDAIRRLAYFVRAEGESLQFAHQLVRDTAYETLPYRLRRDLHGTAGDLLEARAFEPDEIAEVLSLHFTHAARPDKAWHYSRIGGERAAEKYAYVQAEELYTRAVQAAKHMPSLPTGVVVAANIALGDARFRIGRQQEALEPFQVARRALQDDPRQAALLLRREAVIEYRRGRLSVGLSKLTRGLHLLGEKPGTHLAARSSLEAMYAGIRQQQGRYQEALGWARRAERHAAESGDPAAQAEAMQAVLQAQAMLDGTFDTEYAKRGLVLYERIGDRAGQSLALNNLGMLAWMDGRGLEALETFRRAEQVATEAGDMANAAGYRNNVGDVLVRLGRLREAQRLLSELLPVLRSYSLDDAAACATRALGTAIALAGSADEGMELLARARDRLEELAEPVEVVETDAALGLVLLSRGDPEAAVTVARTAAQRAEALDAVHLLPSLLRLEGAALSDLGEFADARSVLDRALKLSDRHSRVERGFVLAELSRVEARDGSSAAAEDFAVQADAAFAELGFAGSDRYPIGHQPM